MKFLDSLLKLLTSVFASISTYAKYPLCIGYFYEPEIPAELLEEE